MTLIKNGTFKSHSGVTLPFKIDCDSLSLMDWNEIAKIIAVNKKFSSVYGVPRGGVLLAHLLLTYSSPDGPNLIVDDVLTTGKSMEEARLKYPNSIGVVVFARGPCPDWVSPIFTLGDWIK